MTLTSILPTLRHSIPSPFTRDAWPAGSSPTCDDVVLRGVSILRYVDLCGTPSVTTGPAVIPLSGGVASALDDATILACSVVLVDHDGAVPLVVVDAALHRVAPRWSEARLLGRISAAADRRFAVRDAADRDVDGVALILPGDLAPGDLVAMPCPGAVGVGDVRMPRPEAVR